jgi:NADH-quinone oxidoreductase subunit J
MTLNQFMFILFSGIIVAFSILTVTSRKILRAAVYLLFVLVSTAGLYFMLNFNFLAAVQLTLYAGGIVVLIIFSILLTSHIEEKLDQAGVKQKIFAAIAAVAGIILCLTAILQFPFTPAGQEATKTDVSAIGTSLLNYGEKGYALPFEVISILLLAAMIGAIVIAKKETKK